MQRYPYDTLSTSPLAQPPGSQPARGVQAAANVGYAPMRRAMMTDERRFEQPTLYRSPFYPLAPPLRAYAAAPPNTFRKQDPAFKPILERRLMSVEI